MKKILVIGATLQDGRSWAAENVVSGEPIVVSVVNHALGARGRSAAAVLATPAARRHPGFDEALAVCVPCTFA